MRTVYKEACAEIVVEKSRFIAYIKPVSSVEDAEAFIAAIRKNHWDATHNVPIYIVGERGENQKCSDDGEPSGTSGPPVLQMLSKEMLTDVVIVITRYFGGVKLGTGGLVRAYTQAAKLALKEAGICDIVKMAALEVVIDYAYYDKLQKASEGGLFSIEKSDFSDVVEVTLLVKEECQDELKEMLRALTFGSFTVTGSIVRLDKKLDESRDE